MEVYFSLRRCFYYLLAVTAFLVLAINLLQTELFDDGGEELGRLRKQDEDHSSPDNTLINPREAELDKWLLENESLESTLVASQLLPWYFEGGVRYPLPAVRKTGRRRLTRLWPQEDPDKDRITNQLMFVPPRDEEASQRPLHLKKILFYNGLGGICIIQFVHAIISLSQWLLENESLEPTLVASQPLPWYFKGGMRYPLPAVRKRGGRRLARLWPQEDPGKDRIINQLMFVPPRDKEASQQPPHLKKILFYNGLGAFGTFKPGREVFQSNKCPVNTCTVTANTSESTDADAILFRDYFVRPEHRRPSEQVWILYFLESPYHTPHISHNDLVNWTSTYRRDSDLVAPYERWTYYDERVKEWPGPTRNFAANKTHQVAWFVSNCGARNGRLQYALELQKYISVDIFGACGTKKCSRSMAEKCFELLNTTYKFYLSFENSNCKDYITEKFFVNGLGQNILPIVMGARREDYEASAPLNSFIHVDDFESPKALADYLHKLDTDDEAYNTYFKWKGTGEFINTYFFCRLCALLHDDYPRKSYRNFNEWWSGPGTC